MHMATARLGMLIVLQAQGELDPADRALGNFPRTTITWSARLLWHGLCRLSKTACVPSWTECIPSTLTSAWTRSSGRLSTLSRETPRDEVAPDLPAVAESRLPGLRQDARSREHVRERLAQAAVRSQEPGEPVPELAA